MTADDDELEAWVSGELDEAGTASLERLLDDDHERRVDAAEQLALDHALRGALAPAAATQALVEAAMVRVRQESAADRDLARRLRASPPVKGVTLLRVATGSAAGRALILDTHGLRIGRAKDCALRLSDAGVSRQHAELLIEDGAVRIRDLDSSHGTLVNGAAITGSCSLHARDRIQLGAAVLVFCDGELAGRPRLLGISGGAAGIELPLVDDRTVLGRAEAEGRADLAITDAAASRIHAAVIRRGACFALVDQGSRNGTLLNGELITDAQTLRSGDLIGIGEARLVFLDGRVDDRVGTRMGGCTLLERRGQGSLGVSYRAIRERDGQPVAIKIFDPADTQDHAFRARLLNAARALGRIEQPHIHSTLEAGLEDDLVWVISPWACGGSAAELIAASESLAPERIAALGQDIAMGLGQATTAGLQVLALRPGDILFDGKGRTRVADLGLNAASGQGRCGSGIWPTTQPDQLHADLRKQLGACCWQLLCGRAWQADGPRLDELQPDCPVALRRIIDSLLNTNADAEPPDWESISQAFAGAVPSIRHTEATRNARHRSAVGSHHDMPMPRGLRSLVILAFILLAILLSLMIWRHAGG